MMRMFSGEGSLLVEGSRAGVGCVWTVLVHLSARMTSFVRGGIVEGGWLFVCWAWSVEAFGVLVVGARLVLGYLDCRNRKVGRWCGMSHFE